MYRIKNPTLYISKYPPRQLLNQLYIHLHSCAFHDGNQQCHLSIIESFNLMMGMDWLCYTAPTPPPLVFPPLLPQVNTKTIPKTIVLRTFPICLTISPRKAKTARKQSLIYITSIFASPFYSRIIRGVGTYAVYKRGENVSHFRKYLTRRRI